MKKYGLRIGSVGVEFPSVDDRQKALILFTKGTDVIISSYGIKFSDGEGSFSVYDRDTKETLTVCSLCDGTFLIDTCHRREYPRKQSWADKFETEERFICDACLAKQIRLKEVFDAKKVVGEAEEI